MVLGPIGAYSLAALPYGAGTTELSENDKMKKIKKEKIAQEWATIREYAKKAEEEFLARIETFKNYTINAENEEMEKPLSHAERQSLIKEGLNQEADKIKEESAFAGSMLFTTPFLIPTIKPAFESKKNTIDMFYKSGGAHMDLYTKNPDLMINAQESMQKLERKFAKDYKAAKGNKAALAKIAEERRTFRDLMQKALSTNKEMEIAKATEKCNTAAGVKNGKLARIYRGLKNKPKTISRLDSVSAAESAGKFKSVKPPKKGTSMLRNLCSNKLTWLMTAAMAIIPVALDWGNIQKAKSIDKENEKNGKNTNYGTQQATQTAIKGGASALTYSIMDTAARTVTKKCLGKMAARIAAKVAVKGGCKILGSAIGSVVPGVGTAVGLLVGTAADFLLSKYVFNEMDFFKNSSVKKAELSASNDNELIQQIGESYSMGTNLHNQKLLSILKRKYGTDNFNELKRLHNMPEKERLEYLAKLQEQQALQEQIAQQTNEDSMVA